MTLDGLKSGGINPNSGNGKDHIFKVITGAGKHSMKGAVLKPAVHNMLKDNNYEHYAELNNGVFLVRFRKWNFTNGKKHICYCVNQRMMRMREQNYVRRENITWRDILLQTHQS